MLMCLRVFGRLIGSYQGTCKSSSFNCIFVTVMSFTHLVVLDSPFPVIYAALKIVLFLRAMPFIEAKQH